MPQNNTIIFSLHLVKILKVYNILGKKFYYYTQNTHRKQKNCWTGNSASQVVAGGEHANC
jgi:hypothetical protein